MSVEGLPEEAKLYAEGLENGDIEVITEIEAFVFVGSYQGSTPSPRCAVAFRTAENESPEIGHVRSLLLTEPVLIRLIGILQGRLQAMSAIGGDGHEQSGA